MSEITFSRAWWERRRQLKSWTFVGMVEGAVIQTEDDGTPTKGGNRSTYWNLYERGDGTRKSEKFSPVAQSVEKYSVSGTTSQAKRLAEAAVQAWVHGGPLPTLVANPYSAEPPKKRATLIAFPGGKDGAA